MMMMMMINDVMMMKWKFGNSMMNGKYNDGDGNIQPFKNIWSKASLDTDSDNDSGH